MCVFGIQFNTTFIHASFTYILIMYDYIDTVCVSLTVEGQYCVIQ